MNIKPGMKAKTAYGTPVTIIRELKPFKCNGQDDLQQVRIIYHGQWMECEIDGVNVKDLREIEA